MDRKYALYMAFTYLMLIHIKKLDSLMHQTKLD